MSDNLRDIARDLRTELDELTRVFVEKRHDEATSFMVQSQAVREKISNSNSEIHTLNAKLPLVEFFNISYLSLITTPKKPFFG